MGGPHPATVADGAAAARRFDALTAALGRARGALRAPTAWWAAALAVPLLTALAVVVPLRSDHVVHPWAWGAVHAEAIAGPMLVGLLWWRRRPASRFGPLLIVLGIAAIPPALLASDVPVVFAFGVLGQGAFYWALLYLCATFPAGRLAGRADRLLAGTFAVATFLYVVPPLVFLPALGADTSPIGRCVPACPANPFDVAAARGVVEAAVDTALVLAIVSTAGLGALLARRLLRATRAGRRELALVAAAGLPFFAALTVSCVARLLGAPIGTERALGWALAGASALLPLGFLAALVQAELFASGALRRLLRELASRPPPPRWRAAIAAALDDPGLRLAYWDPARSSFREADGSVLERPAPGDPRHWLPVRHDGRAVAAMTVDEALLEQPELLRAAAQATLVAVRTGTLEGELRDSRRRLVEAGNVERHRIQRDLHDSAQQRLVALRVNLGLVADEIGRRQEKAALDALGEEVEEALAEVRRVAHGLYPPTLDRYGVAEALRSACRLTPLRVWVIDEGLGRRAGAVESTLYFCCLEALQNAAKHAGAGAGASVRLGACDAGVWFAVEDDGVGFDVAAPEGTGLSNMRERVAAMGGTLDIDSEPGGGTRVAGHFPA